MSNIGGRQIIDSVAGSTVTITIDSSVQHTIARWTVAQAVTVNVSGTPVDGQELTMILTNDAGIGNLMTMGAGLLGLGAILGVTSKKTLVSYIANGGTFIERFRTVGI